MDEKRFVITVTNQFFSMGRLIARRMSQLLGVPCYNSFIAEEAARKLNLPQELVSETEERSRPLLAESWLSAMQFGQSSEIQNRIFECQKEIIESLAERENCIIVGRCSDFILGDRVDTMHIYIYAGFEHRVRRCMDELEIDLNEARRLVVRTDQVRCAYHMNYSGYQPDDKNHKHILVDSGLLGVEDTAAFLSEIVRKRFHI